MMFRPTHEQIHETLEKEFGLSVHYGFNADIKDYEFFVYQPINTDPTDKCIWKQNINISYISVNQTDLKELEIYRALRGIGLSCTNIQYDLVQLSNKDSIADVVIFQCVRAARLV